MLVADGRAIGSGVSNLQKHRIHVPFRAGPDLVDDIAIRMLMHFVDEPHVRPRARLRALLARERPEETQPIRHVVHVENAGLLNAARELWRRILHPHRVAIHDHRLVAVSRRGVNLRRDLAVHRQAIEPYRGEQRSFSVALADFDIAVAKPPMAG